LRSAAAWWLARRPTSFSITGSAPASNCEEKRRRRRKRERRTREGKRSIYESKVK
jgi:hypothetical protein